MLLAARCGVVKGEVFHRVFPCNPQRRDAENRIQLGSPRVFTHYQATSLRTKSCGIDLNRHLHVSWWGKVLDYHLICKKVTFVTYGVLPILSTDGEPCKSLTSSKARHKACPSLRCGVLRNLTRITWSPVTSYHFSTFHCSSFIENSFHFSS